MEQRSEIVQQFYQLQYRNYWERAHQAYLDHPDDDFLEELLDEYELPALQQASNRDGLPPAVLAAYDFYYANVEARDIGKVRTYNVPVAGQTTFAVRVTTDGDDGWLEVFDERGNLVSAARTYIELIAWESMEVVRAQVHTGDFPVALANRQELTLWGKPQQRRKSMNIDKLVDAAYHGKSLKDVADASVQALAGISASDAQQLKAAFNVQSVRDLANFKYVKWAQAIVTLADGEE